MDRVRRQIGCEDWITEQYRGRNVTAALLDTGIAMHPDFTGRIVAFHDFVQENNRPYDDSGHGTHVAGCLAGDGWSSGGRYRGIAPSCLLVAGKVLDKAGGGSIDQMLAGIFWVLDNRERYGIRILNISVSIEAQTDPAKSIRLLKAVEEAQKKGILVVVAAGNRGPGARSISPLGRGDHVLTVGCHDKDYRVPGVISCETYSGRGPGSRQMKKPDLVAPGTNITSTSARCKRQNGRIVHAYEPRSGTSFAAPLVSGAAALLWEKDPALSSEEIKHRLCITAQDLNEPWNKQGWGMLDIGRALTRT